MVSPIPKSVKKVWDAWNLRGFIILSLSLQTFLVLFAPFRKRTANIWVVMFIWSAYLLADWAANFAVGLISSSDNNSAGAPRNEKLLAFWAPFLLVHLGGPDTITAFALEDNELWLRHLLGLVFQVVAAAYVFAQTLPDNKLWIPTLLLFLAGIIKYAERTRALYLASLDKFRESMLKEPDPGPNYAKLMEEYASKKDAKLPTQIVMILEPDKEAKAASREVKDGSLDNIEVVQYAYHYFKIFKGLIADLIFSFHERNESRDFFLKRSAEDAFRVIEVELNFIYEVLYTKVVVVHSIPGYVFRFISFSSVMTALGLFHFRTEKRDFNEFDVGITYTLLLGALGLDIIALFMIIFSDWTIADGKPEKKHFAAPIVNRFLDLKKPKWSICKTEPYATYSVLTRSLLFRRWSESVSGYNLIRYCLKGHPIKIHTFGCFLGAIINVCLLIGKIIHFLVLIITTIIYFLGISKLARCLGFHKVLHFFGIIIDKSIDYLGLRDFLDRMRYSSKVPFIKELWEFIFAELRSKSMLTDNPAMAKKISSARGEWVLQDSDLNSKYGNLMQYVEDVDYDQSLILWHIATDLCYNSEKGKDERDDYREFSKLLSDYMLHLLVMQPTMMSAVAGIGQIRFRDTCAEARRFFSRRGLGPQQEKTACDDILLVNTDVEPYAVKGDRSKSVLFDASMLAKELRKLEREEKWKIMSKVWVELLSYAASKCRANTHAQQVCKGGELISFVWLLMAHFGLGEQFQINEGHARAKLIVGK